LHWDKEGAKTLAEKPTGVCKGRVERSASPGARDKEEAAALAPARAASWVVEVGFEIALPLGAAA